MRSRISSSSWSDTGQSEVTCSRSSRYCSVNHNFFLTRVLPNSKNTASPTLSLFPFTIHYSYLSFLGFTNSIHWLIASVSWHFRSSFKKTHSQCGSGTIAISGESTRTSSGVRGRWTSFLRPKMLHQPPYSQLVFRHHLDSDSSHNTGMISILRNWNIHPDNQSQVLNSKWNDPAIDEELSFKSNVKFSKRPQNTGHGSALNCLRIFGSGLSFK